MIPQIIVPQIGVSRDNGDIGLTALPGLTAKTGKKKRGFKN